MADTEDILEALAAARTQTGETLKSVTDRAPTLLVFLRHLG
jgi:hypothetical protein